MKLIFLLTVFVAMTSMSSAQQYDVSGILADTTGGPVANAAVSLLETADSTLAFFGVSAPSGQFKIPSAKAGNYLLQVASIGHRMYYKPLHIPATGGNDLGYIVLREVSQALQEIEVKSQKVPMMIKGDTVEYNAGAYKVKQDAVVEDLLRKMPGIQMDKMSTAVSRFLKTDLIVITCWLSHEVKYF